MKKNLATVSLLTLGTLLAANAQQQPDAGRTLQELKAAPELPAPDRAPLIEAPAPGRHVAGGAKVEVKRISFVGNTLLDEAALQAAVAGGVGQKLDLAGMKALADKVSAVYHAHDYPFAKAFVPAQPMKNGLLVIEIVEGRYGKVSIDGNSRHAAEAQKFLNLLATGEVIEGKKLERTSLILDDQPGYAFRPIIRPGEKVGTGDLSVAMERQARYGGSVSVDNQGNRYTGQYRALTNLYADSALAFGDKVTLSSILTDENMWYGSAGYARGLGYSGLRGNVGYAHTAYELGQDFKALDARGTARIASAGVSYPLIRSQKSNVNLTATYQHKWLTDKQGSAGTTDKKTSDVLPLGVTFDHRDALGGGGVTYGNVTYSHGVLNLKDGLKTTDRTTANTDGDFDKVTFDVARVQATPVKKLTVFGRVSGQVAGGNLDSSEDFGLGGPQGVRAYPTGEGYGDQGALMQLEARYDMGMVKPYAFYDHGYVKTNNNTWAVTSENERDISGFGVGARVSKDGWNADAAMAWRERGGSPKSDSRDNVPQLWVSVGYSF